MQQSRAMSLAEVSLSSVIGFAVSVLANFYILPLFGFHVKLADSFAITFMFMVISIIRSYLVRRFFASYVTKFASAIAVFYEDLMEELYKCYTPSIEFCTPPDTTKCKNLRLDGPTPCWYPNCECFKDVMA